MSMFIYEIVIRLFLTFILSLITTPIVKLLAFRIGAYDAPGERRVNTKNMPTAGGLGIYFVFSFSCLVMFQSIIPINYIWPIILGAGIVVATGLLDDIYELSPKKKTLGIILGALVIYFVAEIRIDAVTLPFLGHIDLRWFSLPLTLFWIFAITNAVNLIDGLDGLASGVSIISLATIGVIGYFFLHAKTVYIPIVIFILVASIAGFFPYNFYPAKIFLGDTGALFLGFMIAVMSLQGLKNATFITVITPMIILGVPITDTVYAIIRRLMNKRPISSADKMHLHHRLLSLGFTHKGAVMTIYGLALVFSFVALLFSYASNVASILLIVFSAIGLELFIEMIGLVGENHQPLMYILRMFGNREFRHQQLEKRLGKHSKKK
ncbi:undecaprenyl-phosphate alpha-N-acetylglucosaminyl 1-phosphate transferase [Enterococcus plantarum]|uniref:Undecaprenyl/decaprenyl-phosphate alpha-N-acetylglucosaminyl 1-phosphate transferase n=1 Tax=Enterococcus plantarum TaxID=1077675 RepID=A0A2W4BHK6_9ENTE|nr:MraY family glycosyltransferase [Enterococcus plantarum]MBO0423888.1 undecaprenyl/decaprenyl-phosphate alpha-N-acetylglucosaminyl 1-phosphate transferase [Enterococcus plantarum]MBO0467764.1 undecaprenyl/decaprenyl-phosphate alpha-N-acetylglucosaminyl 1-phosphate transferase [Enterococcus plantarum]OEG09435.1 undecaprenyl-phosphate alpha-N-acetylglucosaminyl 1-phosphate transferase [Enterococcus plantarum]PZL71689.1 undecaprenyl/decaprenyl-phosphate alpha-N-acetylglucosaminyl 1-phosphate tra